MQALAQIKSYSPAPLPGMCKTCQKKKWSNGWTCLVLNEMIGKYRNCWAWSNDPHWEEKVRQNVEQYAYKKYGNTYKY